MGRPVGAVLHRHRVRRQGGVRPPCRAPSCRSRAAGSGCRPDRVARLHRLGAAPPGPAGRRPALARRRRGLALRAADRDGDRAHAGAGLLAQRGRRGRAASRCCSPASAPPSTGLRWRDLRSSVVAGLFLAAHFAAWLPSLSMTTVAASIALVTTTPIWTALAARISGVRLPAAVWWGLLLAFAGVVLIVGVDVTVSLEALAGDGAGAARRDLRRRVRAGRCARPAAAGDVGVRGRLLLGLRGRDRGVGGGRRRRRSAGSRRATGG